MANIITDAEAMLSPQLAVIPQGTESPILEWLINVASTFLQNYPYIDISAYTTTASYPADVKQACIQLVAQLYNSTNNNYTLASVSLDYYSYTNAQVAKMLTVEVMQLLTAYTRRPSPVVLIKQSINHDVVGNYLLP